MTKIIVVEIILLFIGVAVSPTIHFTTVNASPNDIQEKEITQRKLLFQTILDLTNNKEIQGILLREQIRRGELPDTTIPVFTVKQLRQMYLVGLILSKTISKPKMYSLIEKYQVNNQFIRKEITAVIEKDAILNEKITLLSNSQCDCENENTTQ